MHTAGREGGESGITGLAAAVPMQARLGLHGVFLVPVWWDSVSNIMNMHIWHANILLCMHKHD